MSESNRIINNICAKGYYCMFITRMFSTFITKIIKAPIYYYLDVYYYIYYYMDFYCYIYYYLNISVLFLTIYPTRYSITHILKSTLTSTILLIYCQFLIVYFHFRCQCSLFPFYLMEHRLTWT